MRALRLRGSRATLDRDTPEPQLPGDDWALLRVRAAGVCSTDLELIKGYMGFEGTLGHEFVAEVERGPDDWRGARVTCEINVACRDCPTCARGHERHCPHRSVLGIQDADGAFADKIAAPLANLHRVPDALPDAWATFAEPTAAAFEILEQVPHVSGQRALVLGDGRLGSLCAQVLRHGGAQVEVCGRHAHKLRALAALDLSTRLLDRDPPPTHGYDLVVEATGSEAGLALAMDAVRPRGTLVLKSTVAAAHQLNLAPLVIHEVTVVGSRCGPFAPAIAALASGAVQVAPLIDATYPLDDAEEALAHAGRKGIRKVLIEP